MIDIRGVVQRVKQDEIVIAIKLLQSHEQQLLQLYVDTINSKLLPKGFSYSMEQCKRDYEIQVLILFC